MKAMVLEQAGRPLELREVPDPRPRDGQLLIQVEACGVCRTDLHVVDGDLREPRLPLIPGHEIVGRITAIADGVSGFAIGQRVGVPWLGSSCGGCRFCLGERENLCDAPSFTGYTLDGGYAESTVADARFCFPMPEAADPRDLAPLLCAGLIGYRAYRMSGEASRIGLYGFGAAAHIVAQLAVHDGRQVFAFTKPDDIEGQNFARSLGACWAGDSLTTPPVELDAAILFAPVGALVPTALRAVGKGGRVVCAGIHMSDIPSFPYDILWGERSIQSVANLTRRDGAEFLQRVSDSPISVARHDYPLRDANQALDDLRAGRFEGAAVLDLRSEAQ